ncbi:aminotransferase class I/II-fold pyridoxal phosphate-dependent enzyme [Spirochaetia bacterium 38H-sp]|uniref:Aminotransferase class I/II-fold pyridoxal phosphate-dependent enzyme n=1 Tax=Rarispira pelagica TaxID=3141764 RepID=A0ABU9U8J9_9SPIR
MFGFASDNTAPVHPRIFEAMQKANMGYYPSYGEDLLTERAVRLLCKLTGAKNAFFVHTGTSANILGMAPFLRPYNSVLCSHIAHINTHECGALQRATGARVLPILTKDGKLRTEDIRPQLNATGNYHESQPAIISITQPTEIGTLYSLAEIKELADFAHKHGLLLHMDGARFSQAAAALGINPEDMTSQQGVDILSLGGAKNGLMYGEAIVFFKHTDEIRYHIKQGMQLASKMRYIAAQFLELYGTDLWLELAGKANKMAKILEKGLDARGIKAAYPVETNAVFVPLNPATREKLLKKYMFYVWEEEKDICRLMCSYHTEEKEIEDFLAALDEAMC